MRPAATPTQRQNLPGWFFWKASQFLSPSYCACWATCMLPVLESIGWLQMWLGMFQSTSHFISNGVVLKRKSPRCNCWFFPVTFLFLSLTNCTNKMTSGRYRCSMSFKFWTLYAGWRVCDETSQADMEQQWNHWLTVVILYFIVVGNKNIFFFQFLSFFVSLLPWMNSFGWKYQPFVGGISMVRPYSK